MDPDAFSASLFKWDPRSAVPPLSRMLEAVAPPPPPPQPMQTFSVRARELGSLEDLLQPYGIRYFTAAKIAELGFTVNTLLDMKDEELDEMMNSLSHIFRWDLLVGERYGIKAAVRAERRRHQLLLPQDTTNALDALSQEGLSVEPVQHEKEAGGSGGRTWEMVGGGGGEKQRRRKKGRSRIVSLEEEDDETEGAEENESGGGCGSERQREHPFIVTVPGEVARGKKNGLDYLFHLYEQCHDFLIQVQNIAKERGEKCPTKVTNQVFRFAKKSGASYINKPKMRHYVHCYALHCLDEEASNALRRSFKERGENVGAWRQACYKPLVIIAARQGWDIDAIFNAHPRLSIWYVPTKIRQLCHAERSNATASSSVTGGATDHLLF
ncbi:protein ALF [Olea europaea var. sylvestris]|uniref:Floricaula/leafy-like transcription factor n=1 Tax=Olea europaea subsp. europaea TaxID=158383 RepID=A0A8S0PG06_OLEEU|nr:protein ALF [Olea europaea var. sylvestris]CAA2948253.1 LEAFY [Olea europaea subsp. europaea]